jgi:glycyl-tRNA synthetase beta chain
MGDLLKRAKNITKDAPAPPPLGEIAPITESAEFALRDALAALTVGEALDRGDYDAALEGIASLGPAVTMFFDKILVNADDRAVRTARLALVATVRDLILRLADLSEMAAETT